VSNNLAERSRGGRVAGEGGSYYRVLRMGRYLDNGTFNITSHFKRLFNSHFLWTRTTTVECKKTTTEQITAIIVVAEEEGWKYQMTNLLWMGMLGELYEFLMMCSKNNVSLM
jgi:hypothetical protein